MVGERRREAPCPADGPVTTTVGTRPASSTRACRSLGAGRWVAARWSPGGRPPPARARAAPAPGGPARRSRARFVAPAVPIEPPATVKSSTPTSTGGRRRVRTPPRRRRPGWTRRRRGSRAPRSCRDRGAPRPAPAASRRPESRTFASFSGPPIARAAARRRSRSASSGAHSRCPVIASRHPHGAAHHLAGGVAGQRLRRQCPAGGDLVAGDPRLHVLAQLLRGRGRIGPSTTTAATSSPRSGWGTPSTMLSRTSGMVSRAFSTSAG